MVKLDIKNRCELCGSIRQDIIINDKFEKILIYKCFDVNCANYEKEIENFGFSLKHKLKHDKINNN